MAMAMSLEMLIPLLMASTSTKPVSRAVVAHVWTVAEAPEAETSALKSAICVYKLVTVVAPSVFAAARTTAASLSFLAVLTCSPTDQLKRLAASVALLMISL